VLKELSEKYGKTPAKIVLNWHLSRNILVIPKTQTVSRLKENIEVDDFVMSAEDLAKISKLANGFRICDPTSSQFVSVFNYTPMFA